MNKRKFRRLIGFILTAILLVGIFMIAASTAAAQRRARRVVVVRTFRPYDPFRFNRLDYYRYREYVFDNGQEAYSEGYEEGCGPRLPGGCDERRHTHSTLAVRYRVGPQRA